jgi:hypothetical protein
LVGKLPKAIANEFLYYQPSLLLWVDELACDANALAAEAEWAGAGFLVSDLSIKLRDKGIIRSENYAHFFQGGAIPNLLLASQSDAQASKDVDLLQYATPDPTDIGHYSHTGFEDVNALLYLSSLVGLPHLNTRPASRFYEWKFARIAKEASSSRLERELPVLSEILSFSVPAFELFPRNEALLRAEAAKRDLLLVATAYARGDTSQLRLQESYDYYLKQWLQYDNGVRLEVLDNFAVLTELREDKRLRSLRAFLKSFSDAVTRHPGDPDFQNEVSLRLKRDILEAERSIAQESTTFEFLDKCTSYVSFPIAAATTIAGAAATVLTLNPLFLALGIAPGFLQWSSDALSDFRRRRFSWHFYLLDFKVKLDRAKELRALDKKIKELGS